MCAGVASRLPDGSCPLFPANNPWLANAQLLPVHPRSEIIKRHISSSSTNLHPDYGGGYMTGRNRILYGVPYIKVDSSRGQAMVPIKFVAYGSESDPGMAEGKGWGGAPRWACCPPPLSLCPYFTWAEPALWP